LAIYSSLRTLEPKTSKAFPSRWEPGRRCGKVTTAAPALLPAAVVRRRGRLQAASAALHRPRRQRAGARLHVFRRGAWTPRGGQAAHPRRSPADRREHPRSCRSRWAEMTIAGRPPCAGPETGPTFVPRSGRPLPHDHAGGPGAPMRNGRGGHTAFWPVECYTITLAAALPTLNDQYARGAVIADNSAPASSPVMVRRSSRASARTRTLRRSSPDTAPAGEIGPARSRSR